MARILAVLALFGSASAFAPMGTRGVVFRNAVKSEFKVTLKNPEGDAVRNLSRFG